MELQVNLYNTQSFINKKCQLENKMDKPTPKSCVIKMYRQLTYIISNIYLSLIYFSLSWKKKP